MTEEISYLVRLSNLFAGAKRQIDVRKETIDERLTSRRYGGDD
jgi:hypothetical protein